MESEAHDVSTTPKLLQKAWCSRRASEKSARNHAGHRTDLLAENALENFQILDCGAVNNIRLAQNLTDEKS